MAGKHRRIRLRDARESDWRAISDVAMRSKAYWGYSAEFMEQCRDELSIDAARLADVAYVYRVAAVNDEIVGFHAVHTLESASYELEGLFVLPEHIGQGIGKQLIEDAVQLVAREGGGEIVIQGDPNAERFYLAAGAVQIGERESGSIAGRTLPLFRIKVAAARKTL